MAERRLAVSLGAEAAPVGELVFESSRPTFWRSTTSAGWGPCVSVVKARDRKRRRSDGVGLRR